MYYTTIRVLLQKYDFILNIQQQTSWREVPFTMSRSAYVDPRGTNLCMGGGEREHILWFLYTYQQSEHARRYEGPNKANKHILLQLNTILYHLCFCSRYALFCCTAMGTSGTEIWTDAYAFCERRALMKWYNNMNTIWNDTTIWIRSEMIQQYDTDTEIEMYSTKAKGLLGLGKLC